ncbi:unnamed protein product [Bursaphelenchus okinawaensis]|uniref:FERM domain-containing protein n=1 Tax=Bursaphelenchus okinawaensis TaxID=465554 RepID=A0A811JTM3_9BILA|nr:unnamed protein product [Bursaphelenchus okinawaensis]CAG9082456.1 unnamed protein product [Bursaphelenchus okinawaensis]
MMEEPDNDFLNTSFDKSASFKSGVIRRIQSSASFISLAKFNVAVQLLDDSEIISNEFGKNTLGKDILELACNRLDITDKEYFGLRYNSEFKYRFWLDLDKTLHREFNHENVGFCFRFRFYPVDPVDLADPVVKDLLCIQLQRDLLHGRLQSTHETAAQLGALILQGNIGDYDEERNPPGYVSGYKLVLKQSEKLEEKIAEIHQTYSGWSKDDAFDQFLRIASCLDTYGFDPYSVKTQKNEINVVIGSTPKYFIGFVFNQIVFRIPWMFIKDIDHCGKNVVLTLIDTYFQEYLHQPDCVNPETVLNSIPGPAVMKEALLPTPNKKQLKFVCPKSTYAKHLWKHLLSQKIFYNESSVTDFKPKFSRSRVPLFRGSLFRCPTARTMKEMKAVEVNTRIQKSYSCHTLPRQKPISIINSVSESITSLDEKGDMEIIQEKVIVQIREEAEEVEEGIAQQVQRTTIVTTCEEETPAEEVQQESVTVTKEEIVTVTVKPQRTEKPPEPDVKRNGVHRVSYSEPKLITSRSTAFRLISAILTVVLIMLLISGVIYVVFEVPTTYTTHLPYFGELRYNHYIPLKTKLTKLLNL